MSGETSDFAAPTQTKSRVRRTEQAALSALLIYTRTIPGTLATDVGAGRASELHYWCGRKEFCLHSEYVRQHIY